MRHYVANDIRAPMSCTGMSTKVVCAPHRSALILEIAETLMVMYAFLEMQAA